MITVFTVSQTLLFLRFTIIAVATLCWVFAILGTNEHPVSGPLLAFGNALIAVATIKFDIVVRTKSGRRFFDGRDLSHIQTHNMIPKPRLPPIVIAL